VWMPMSFGEGGSLTVGPDTEWRLEDLKPYHRWTMDTVLPDTVWLRDTSHLPSSVEVTTNGRTETLGVSWDAASVAQPGPAKVKGTLSDGRWFTRDIVVVPHNLRFAVNAGGAATADWTKTVQAAGTESGLLNSTPEQPLGPDARTGVTWGYTGTSGTYGGAGDNLYSTLRWAKNKESLVYSFSGLEAGTYTVYAGYFDPWPWANRAARVSVNAAVVDEQRLFTTSYTSGEYADIVVGQDGKVTVTVAPTRSPDIQLSWLMVARQG
jgi:hypothetical protein